MSEETPKKYPILIIESKNPKSSLEVSALVSAADKVEVIYEMKPQEPQPFDWEKLRESLKNTDFGFKGERNKSLIADLRGTGEPQVLRKETQGIYPVREGFEKRMSQQCVLGTVLTLAEKAAQGDAESARLLQKIDALSDFIHYDPQTQTCSLVSNPEEATGYIIDSMSQYTALHKFNYTTTNLSPGPAVFEASTATQRKKQKREAKISLKKGQNYLKIGKRQ